MRRLAPVLLAMLALIAALSVPTANAATVRAHASASKVSVKLLNASQTKIVGKRRLKVKVRVRQTSLVRVFATARRKGKFAPVVVTRARELKVRKGRKGRILSLKLARAGRAELRGCSSRRIAVYASVVKGLERRPIKTARSKKRLRRDTKLCRSGKGGEFTGGSEPGAKRPIAFKPPDPDRCDFIDPFKCLFPWPSDHFTTTDKTTATKRRLNLKTLSMPKNRAGKPIQPGPYNRNDGFSPGQKIVTKVPGLDTQSAFNRTGVVPIGDMRRAYDAKQPVVVINTKTKARHLIYAEIDSNPKSRDDVNLIIRPGTNFKEGTRYIVALRRMKTASGGTISPNTGFRVYRDAQPTTNKTVEGRRGHFEGIFQTLAQAGIDRDDLYRAWDFTVASEKNLSERMLAIRDSAFRGLGDSNLRDLTVQGSAPSFTVTQVRNNPDSDGLLAKQVEGTFTVPCYLDQPGCPSGSRFAYPPGSRHGPPLAIPGNTMTARFTCNIPRSTNAGPAARPSLYGHGLLGSRGEANQAQLRRFGNEHNFVFCATDWIGMACADVPFGVPPSQGDFEDILRETIAGRPPNLPNCDLPNIAGILQDVSSFPTLTDRVQQGMLNFTYLGRLMIHPNGFNSNAAFKVTQGGATRGVIDTRRLFYDGNSQGGIIGGSLMAIQPDAQRGVLGVTGMNYSTLLRRSVDFDLYANGDFGADTPAGLYDSYPDESERPLLLSLMQVLWDRAEANGYAQHMTSDPLPNTPAHQVMLHVGLGDHQVSQYAAEVEARTIGASAVKPWADSGRDLDREDVFGIPGISKYPFGGSAIVLWDIGPLRTVAGRSRGTPPPPATNVPPRAGNDPHEGPRNEASARRQKAAFLKIGGGVINVCGSRPCYAEGWAGP